MQNVGFLWRQITIREFILEHEETFLLFVEYVMIKCVDRNFFFFFFFFFFLFNLFLFLYTYFDWLLHVFDVRLEFCIRFSVSLFHFMFYELLLLVL